MRRDPPKEGEIEYSVNMVKEESRVTEFNEWSMRGHGKWKITWKEQFALRLLGKLYGNFLVQ